MTMPYIREAKPGDERGIHEAHMRSIREVCVRDHGEEEIRGWGHRPLSDRWVDAIKVGHVWVVEQRDCIYGLAHLRLFKEAEETKAYLHALYLTPEILRMGFGIKLANLMLEKARSNGVKALSLDSSITAHAFYQRLGFSDIGPMKRVEIGGYPVRCFPMVLNLV